MKNTVKKELIGRVVSDKNDKTISKEEAITISTEKMPCLLYTSDAADE